MTGIWTVAPVYTGCSAEQSLLSVRPAQPLEGWMLKCTKKLLWFEDVIKITCSGWVIPVLPPIPRIGCSETLKSVLQAGCFVLECFLNFWPLLHERVGS